MPSPKPCRLLQAPAKRIVTFVIGGVTRSELRVTHMLSSRLGRDITLGSTSMETPASFLQRVQVRRACPLGSGGVKSFGS